MARKPSSRQRVVVDSVTPFLWFDRDAQAAAKLYTSLIQNSRITEVSRVRPGGPVLTVAFELNGQRFLGLNGGPIYPHSPAFSIFVTCRGQREVDRLWTALTRGGEESRCGWLVDRFGLSWQIIPRRLLELLQDRDPRRARRATEAMMTMRKIDVPALEAAVAAAE
ncbi:MAG TPA: VOC family protein [Thermoplasmata archaeon]|nr:VOC family protein [Thermoplasmata archaeon]